MKFSSNNYNMLLCIQPISDYLNESLVVGRHVVGSNEQFSAGKR